MLALPDQLPSRKDIKIPSFVFNWASFARRGPLVETPWVVLVSMKRRQEFIGC